MTGVVVGAQLLINRRTKIVATIGPASSSVEIIEELVDAGVDMFRLNMSHGDHETHRVAVERVREASRQADRHVAVLVDLCGPKIRVGKFADGAIRLVDGGLVTITTRDVVGTDGLIPSRYSDLSRDVHPGAQLLLADGLLELEVLSIEGTEVRCRVVRGGELSDGKGINLPGCNVSAPSLTEKDLEDARFAIELGADYVAQSFVGCADDVLRLREFIASLGHLTPIIAKIERPQALEDREAVIEAADAIMVARGDLGVELPPEQVPVAQRLLVDMARTKRRPVIVATQMLESMIEAPRPTRAEVADVAQAAFDGADAVMLSAETAVGKFPVRAVEMMDRIARETEGYLWREGAFGRFAQDEPGDPPIECGVAIARSTALLSRDLRVRSILALSARGLTATALSSARPAAPVLAASPSAATCRRMSLLWGVVPIDCTDEEFDDPVELGRGLVAERGLADSGDYIVLVRGFDSDPRKNTPSITLLNA